MTRSRFDILEHEVGFVVGWERDADGESYWRMTQFSLPPPAPALNNAG